jgi:hypothetical protein
LAPPLVDIERYKRHRERGNAKKRATRVGVVIQIRLKADPVRSRPTELYHRFNREKA